MSTIIIDGETYRTDFDARSHEIEVHRLNDDFTVDRVGQTKLPKDVERGSVQFVKEQRDAIKEMIE